VINSNSRQRSHGTASISVPIRQTFAGGLGAPGQVVAPAARLVRNIVRDAGVVQLLPLPLVLKHVLKLVFQSGEVQGVGGMQICQRKVSDELAEDGLPLVDRLDLAPVVVAVSLVVRHLPNSCHMFSGGGEGTFTLLA